MQKFQEVISSWYGLKEFFVSSKTIHEIQILSGLMVMVEKNLKWHSMLNSWLRESVVNLLTSNMQIEADRGFLKRYNTLLPSKPTKLKMEKNCRSKCKCSAVRGLPRNSGIWVPRFDSLTTYNMSVQTPNFEKIKREHTFS